MNYAPHTGSLRGILPGRATSPRINCHSWLTAAAVVCTLLTVRGLSAQAPKPTDFQVKAAYLYNFGRFVEWPTKTTAARGNAFVVCILGQDPFGSVLNSTLAGETINGKRVVAKRVSGPPESGDCQILFLSVADDGRLKKIIEAVDKNGVLTVSDMPQFLEHGGMIQFVLEGNRVRFEVNLAATQNAGLTLSSELLKVASAVRGNSSRRD